MPASNRSLLALAGLATIGVAAGALDKLYGAGCLAYGRLFAHEHPNDCDPSFAPSKNLHDSGPVEALPSKGNLVVADWNIARAKSWRTVADSLSRTRDAHPDLGMIALQEAPGPDHELWNGDVFKEFRFLYAPDEYRWIRRNEPIENGMQRGKHIQTFGNALLTRFPVETVSVVDLPAVAPDIYGPRNLFWRNAILARGKELITGVSHFDLHTKPNGRAAQAARFSSAFPATPALAIVGVDANFTGRREEKGYHLLNSGTKLHDTEFARPARRFADYILVRGELRTVVREQPGTEIGHPLLVGTVYRRAT